MSSSLQKLFLVLAQAMANTLAFPTLKKAYMQERPKACLPACQA
jgi:hypothetical protein